MSYIASIHKASSVRHALKTNFLSPDSPSLVVAKSNRAEVYDFSGDGLTLRTSFTIYGRITALLAFRPQTSPADHLFVATDRYDYLTVSWDAERGTIRNERTARDVADRFLRDARCGPLYLSDPGGRMLGLHVYEGLLLIIPLVQQGATSGKGRRKAVAADQIGNLDEHTPIRMNELMVTDMTFLYGTEEPALAVLHTDGAPDSSSLKTYRVVKSGGSLVLELWSDGPRGETLEADAKILIPVAAPGGGVVVIGEQTVWYHSLVGSEKPRKYPLYAPTIFHAWGMIDAQRYLLGDEAGGLHLMLLDVDENGRVDDIRVEQLGKTSTPTKLIYLDNGHVFVGSHYGDSQLVRLSSCEPRCQVVQTFSSLAPVLDFRVLDTSPGGEEQQQQYSSGQMRIVTGSGGFYDGGLRSMKSGVGLDDLAILGDMEGVRGLWALKADPSSTFDDTLVVSFLDETRVFSFDAEGEVEELEDFKGFTLDEETLATANLPGGKLLQVRGSGIKLVDAEGGTVISEITPESGAKINMASVGENMLVCSIGGTSVVAYDCTNDLQEVGKRSFENEVACLTVAAAHKACAIGFWTSSSVSVLSLPALSTLAEESLGGGADGVAVPRSVMFARVLAKQAPTLLVAMGDGTVYTFTVNEADYALSQKKTIALTTQAVYFHAIPREADGTVSVFAACDNPSLLYGDGSRISYSAVTADKVTHVTPFNAQAFPSSVVCLAGGELKIATVDTVRNVHVKTLSIGDAVRRVAYSEDRKIFGIVTIHSDLDPSSGEELMACFVRVVDDETFSLVDSYELEENELVESILCARLDNGDETSGEKFVVGTGFQASSGADADADAAATTTTSDDSPLGRILVFEFSDDRRLKLAAELRVKAAVKCLDMVGDKIVVALNKTVEIYAYTYPATLSRPKLKRLAQYRAHSEPIDVGVHGNVIAVGDLMKGPSMLVYAKGEDGRHSLTELARTYRTSWTTAVEMLDEDTVISGDAEGNMSLWRREKTGVTEEDRRRLELVGEVKIGELVNRIRRVDERLLPDMTVQPKAYFATVDGTISLLGVIHPTKLDLLMKLQSNMSAVVKGVGDLDFNRWRAFSTPQRYVDEPLRVVDGDFVERFLELPEDVAAHVVNGVGRSADALGVEVEEVRALLERLRRLH